MGTIIASKSVLMRVYADWIGSATNTRREAVDS